jgi:dipeptidyl-peptidase-4
MAVSLIEPVIRRFDVESLAIAPALSGELTIERMYTDPRLTGITPRNVSWSPDGKTLAFLWNESGQRYYDIWLYNASKKKLRRGTELRTLPEG